jgi:hypothetical protein
VRSARFALLFSGIAVGSIFVCVVFAACGYADPNGDPIADNPVNLPNRKLGDGGDTTDGTTIAQNPNQNNNNNNNNANDGGQAKPPSTTCQAMNLALCLRFEGNTMDQSATAINPIEATGIAFVGGGKEDQAAQFTQTSALRFAPNPVFDLPASGATIEAWIKREATGADAVVFDDDARFSLTINAAGNVWCKSSGGAVVGATQVPVAQWAHVACVVENGTLKAYLNGVIDASGTGSIVASPTSAAAIGGNSPTGEHFVGLIDSFRVFKSARSATELAAAAK